MIVNYYELIKRKVKGLTVVISYVTDHYKRLITNIIGIFQQFSNLFYPSIIN